MGRHGTVKIHMLSISIWDISRISDPVSIVVLVVVPG
jgi:hypothetical protein